MLGQVKWFNDDKGFGFIEGTDFGVSGRDYFVYYTDIIMEGRKTLIDGQKVKFDLINCDKGLKAINVEPYYYEC